jgi:hypothetical protein
VSLTVEDGTGVAGADSYATQAWIDGYWTARPHLALSSTWTAATSDNKDGAAREATAYLDAAFGNFYRGKRRGYVQGLLWPRTDAKDEQGYPLPDLPDALLAAEAELAARALSAPLAADIDAGTRIRVQTKKVGPIEKSTEYFDAGQDAPKTSFGFVSDMLAPILNGTQPNAPNPTWAWS